MVCAAVGERMHMVERRGLEIERIATIDAAPTAVAHRGALDRALVPSTSKLADAGALRAGWTWKSGKHDVVTLSPNGHFTSLEKTTPRNGRNSQCGASVYFSATTEARHCRARR